jgi:glucose-1-phosphate cytidylyltransferase
MEVHNKRAEPWTVTLVDTGEATLTGGRLKRVADYLGDEDFCFTYGDGVSDLDISKEIEFHKSHGKLATVAAVQPPGRYGALHTDDDGCVQEFSEKPQGDGGYINGGFFVLSPKVLDYIDDDQTAWEGSPLVRLSEEGQLMSYRHDGFWLPMDTLRDRNQLEALWQSGRAPWKIWE